MGSEYFEDPKPYSNNIKDYFKQGSYEKRKEFSDLNSIHLKESFERNISIKFSQGVTGLRKSIVIADADLKRVGEFRVP